MCGVQQLRTHPLRALFLILDLQFNFYRNLLHSARDKRAIDQNNPGVDYSVECIDIWYMHVWLPPQLLSISMTTVLNVTPLYRPSSTG